MGVEFEWATADEVIMLVRVERPWTWQEYRQVLDELTVVLANQPHPVATIVDVSRIGGIPNDGNVMNNLKYIDQVLPENVFGSVIVGAPVALNAFMTVLMQVRQKTKRIALFAQTIEEAHVKLNQRYQELYGKPLSSGLSSVP